MRKPKLFYETVLSEISKHLSGMERPVKALTIAMLSRGHVLLEGVPGTAKTTLAKLFAQTLGLEFKRVQMTPDTLPMDLIGGKVFDPKSGQFRTILGPIFTNVLLVDEINRASPRTQSALIEAMQEGQVTIEGETYELPKPFFVIATMNPVEMVGTYQLPEVAKDRFTVSVDLRFPPREVEIEAVMLDAMRKAIEPKAEKSLDKETVLQAIEEAQAVEVPRKVAEYAVDLVRATRERPEVLLGATTRAAIHLVRAAKAKASIEDREVVITDDVKEVAPMVLVHRLVVEAAGDRLFLARDTAEKVVREILEEVEPPA
ncbi:ATPase [Ignicoccus islandicus DSM 13165]|uniref:ATPase n=1 Tax=Ignicoccus islandicus DSM 13165 TaxID=940295 RepID=A0A0U3FHW1_9CREN|nr:MoxR family ATPase [Ignicoccus islandicus]ALU11494.1 ATPase [Ignicoccus islandicus DSM 13165]